VVLEMAQDVAFRVSVDGTLDAIGTEDDPIVFRGASAGTRGYWQGIDVKSGGNDVPNSYGATFEHCQIEDAGSDNWSGNSESIAALYLQDTSAALITNTTFENSGRYGLWASGNARIDGFSDNTFTGNARTMILHPDRVGEMAGTSTIDGNDDDGIWIVFGNGDRVSVDATWHDLGVPYRVRTRFYVEAALTLEAGVTLSYTQGVSTIIEEEGSITANGTSDDPVVFTGENEVATGYWQGLRFKSNDAANDLTYTTISYAGSDGFTGNVESLTAIYIDSGAQVTLTNVTLGPGGGYGLFLTANDSAVSCTSVSFDTLDRGNVYANYTTPSSVLAACP
jgi:hypothetical protein